MAIIILRIVPHAGDVERLFSDLGGVQDVKRVNLSMDTFESIGKIKGNLRRHEHATLKASGIRTRRRHAHMHTHEGMVLTEGDDGSLSWTPPLSANTPTQDIHTEPDVIDLTEVDAAFESIAKEIAEAAWDEHQEDLVAGDVLAKQVYSFAELDRVDKGIKPVNFSEDITNMSVDDDEDWSVDAVLRANGILSA
jgi:hypothetical protein